MVSFDKAELERLLIMRAILEVDEAKNLRINANSVRNWNADHTDQSVIPEVLQLLERQGHLRFVSKPRPAYHFTEAGRAIVRQRVTDGLVRFKGVKVLKRGVLSSVKTLLRSQAIIIAIMLEMEQNGQSITQPAISAIGEERFSGSLTRKTLIQLNDLGYITPLSESRYRTPYAFTSTGRQICQKFVRDVIEVL